MSGSAVVTYFISFILIGTMIMLNLFIGIILNGMTEMQAEADERRGVDGLAAIESHLKAMQQEVAKLRAQQSRDSL